MLIAISTMLLADVSSCLLPVSVRGPTAVDWQCDTCDRGSSLGGEKDRKRAKLFNSGETFVGLLREQHVADHFLARDVMCFGLSIDLRLDQRRIDVARTNGIASNALLGGLQRRDLGQSDNAVLCGDIGRL